MARDDYVVIRVTEGGVVRQLYEHRVVWELANGPIPPGFIVHHIDGNKKNNGLGNLVMLSREEHNREHSSLAKYGKSCKGKTLETIYGEEKAAGIRKKLSAAQSKRVYTKERNRAVSEGLKGHRFSDEVKKKMSDSAKARVRHPWSDEVKIKMSLSATRRHQRELAASLEQQDGGGI